MEERDYIGDLGIRMGSYQDMYDLCNIPLEAVGTAVAIIEDDIIIRVNGAFEDLTGFSRSEVENKKNWKEFIALEEDIERLEKYKALRLKDPSLAPRSYELCINDRYGNRKDVMVTVSVIPKTKRFVVSLMDITESKKTDKLLKMFTRLNQKLVSAKNIEELVENFSRVLKEYGGYREIKIRQTKDTPEGFDIISDRDIDMGERLVLDGISQDMKYGIDMLKTKEKLAYTEYQYRSIFENAPVALLEEDITDAVAYLDRLRLKGVEDLISYLGINPREADECLNLLKFDDINYACLKLYEAKSKKELLEDFPRLVPEFCRVLFIKKLVSFLSGEREGEFTGVGHTLEGREIYIYSRWFTIQSRERLKTITAILDLTEEKRLESALRRNLEELYKTFDQVIDVLSSIVKVKDPYTATHQRRVANIVYKIGLRLDLSTDEINRLKLAGLLHDIGKIALPAEILNKPGRLSKFELDLIKTHPIIGYEIIRKVDFLSEVADIILQHHERLDGSGYPNGLKEEEILLPAKILGVADVIEAMTSHRPYRPALPVEEVIKELEVNKGKLYDSHIVDICVELISEISK